MPLLKKKKNAIIDTMSLKKNTERILEATFSFFKCLAPGCLPS